MHVIELFSLTFYISISQLAILGWLLGWLFYNYNCLKPNELASLFEEVQLNKLLNNFTFLIILGFCFCQSFYYNFFLINEKNKVIEVALGVFIVAVYQNLYRSVKVLK